MTFTIVIQAGGMSNRMGTNKGLLPFLGQPMVSRAFSRLSPIADELLITTSRSTDYEALGLPVIPDLIPGRGALGGLYTALSTAKHPLVGVVACDMPFINADLLLAQRYRMIETNADVVIPHTGKGLEPLHAIYRKETCLPHVQAAIEANKWRVDAWFSKVKVEVFRDEEIARYDPHLLSFQNINTPEDLQTALELAARLGL
jgi:molybdopterin-guanine dinucleotide biosynthesis protein A